jgi:putative ABC transport system permease protein
VANKLEADTRKLNLMDELDGLFSALSVDKGFVNTLGLQWKYKPIAYTAGQKTIIINEEAIGKLRLPANPVGQFINTGAGKYLITGVLKNFNFTSMEYAIEPLGLFVKDGDSPFWRQEGCNLFIKIKPHTNLPTLLNTVKDIYKKYDQDTPFSYSFMDEAFNKQYNAEDRLASIFSIFTIITVILAAMGLFGLSAFTIEQRTKEIGIRKVLGANLASITTLLSQDFLKLVILAIIIASPLAWWAMHSWLQNFAFRITISWWVFAFSGLAAVVIAVVTVSYHALKSAVANPVKSLRNV